jgi:hypothetical protein
MQRLRCGDDDPDAVRASMQEPGTEGRVGAILGGKENGGHLFAGKEAADIGK